MAIKQIVPIYITLLGDAASTTFVFPVQNIFQQGFGGSVPFGVTGSIPSSASAPNPPYPVTSVTVDANGNITITFTSPPPAVEFQLELDITFNSGSATSSTPTVSQNVTLTGTSTVTVSGTSAVNLTQLNSVALGSPSNYGTSPGAVSVQGVNAFITNTVPVTLTSTTITGTVAVTQSTSPWVVSNGGTFAVQATQTTSPWVVGGPAASGSAATGNPILNGAVFNTTQPTVTTGQIVDMQATARGALIVATGIDPFTVSQSNTGIVNTTLATWTSATALNTAAAPYTNSLLYSVVQLIINQVGTFSGGIVTFEASLDNTNWYAINGTNVQGTSQSNLTFTTNTLSQFTIASTGLPYFRLRLSQVINGTGTVTLQTSISTAAQVGAVTVTGSVGINYMPGAGTDNTPVPGSTLWVGGMYNASPETYTSGYEASFQMDVHGNLYTDQNYWAGTALGAPTNFGTTPGAVVAASVNASLFQGTTAVGAGAPLQVSLANTGANGTAIAVTMTSTTVTGTVAVTQSTSPWVDNITQWASTALGTPQTFGTAPSGVVIGTSSDLYVAGTRARSNQTTTAAGVQDVNIVGSLGATNSVTNGTFMAITDNTTKVGVIATTTALKTDLSSVAGTATVTAAAGVQKVGIAGATGATVDAASTQNVATPTNGILILGEFNTTPTTITTGNSSPLQLTAAGGVRVAITGSASATLDAVITAATAPANALATLSVYQATQPSLTTGQSVALQNDSAGNLQISLGCNVTTGATLPVALNSTQYITGTATIGAPIGKPCIIVQLNQTTTITAGAVTFEGTYDGTNWVTIPVAQVVHPETFALLTNPYTLVASTNQPFMILMQGYQNMRIRVSTAITGTGTVTPQWD